MMPKLTLAIIAKDEVAELRRIIKDYGQYFDEIAIAYDDDIIYQELHNENIKLYKYTWCDDFSHKRNFLADKVTTEYYLRIDTDDSIKNPELIKDTFDLVWKGNFDVCYVPYYYSFDPDGNINAKHSRETIIKKRPDIYWKKAIHENIFLENPKKVVVCKTDKISIIHNLTDEHAVESNRRNFKALMKEFEQDKENTDPRTIGYIGRVLMGNGEYGRAIPFLELLIKKSGWDDDKYFAWIHLAECHHALGNMDMAIASCNEALAINTKFPDAYLKLGNIYLFKQDYDKALDWLMYGLVRPEPDTQFIIDPSVYGYRARMFIALAYLGKGDYENAYKYFNAAKKLAPNSEFVKGKEKVFEEAYYNDQYLKHFLWLIRYHDTNEKDKIPHLLNGVTKNLLKDERIWMLRTKYNKPKIWGKKSLVIYCGQAWEDWAPPSVVKGIGGSEEAVIYLSKELAKLGWEVTVYNTCGNLAGTYDGVTYREYFELNPNDVFNVIVSWRDNIFAENEILAKKKIVWLHDIPLSERLKGKHVQTFHTILTLSQYHNSLLSKDVPEALRYISSNGINLEDYKQPPVPRNPKRIIYTSSYDRGLAHLLTMWGDVIKEVPDAELHVFYGWETWLSMEQKGFRKKEVRLALQKLMKQKGVFDHGRVGHKELIKEFYKSGIYAYPAHFEEISCISAMKAQACGCVALTTNFAALNETNKYGLKVEGKAGEGDTNERFKKILIKLLKDPKLQDEFRQKTLGHVEEWGWDKVAKDWDKNVLTLKKFEYKDLEDFKKLYATSSDHILIPIERNGVYPRTQTAIDFLKSHPEIKSAIDLGSFDGGLPVHICRAIKGIKCDAMDIRDEEFNHARNLAKKEKLDIDVFTGKAIEEFEPKRTYDMAFLLEVLEHTIDPKLVLKKILGFLNKGGYLMISVPDADGKFGEKQDHLYNYSHLRDYTEKTLKADVPKGYEIVDIFKHEGLINLIARKK